MSPILPLKLIFTPNYVKMEVIHMSRCFESERHVLPYLLWFFNRALESVFNE